jgi:hypothetical protein
VELSLVGRAQPLRVHEAACAQPADHVAERLDREAEACEVGLELAG